MTKFTKEQLIEQANIMRESAEKMADWEGPPGERARAALGVIEIALAALTAGVEQEPVAWTDAEELRDAKEGACGYLFALDGKANKFADPRRMIMLYAAPQLPQPAVGDGRAEFEAWMLKKWGRERQEYDFIMAPTISGQDYGDSYTRCMWKAWSASRADVLQGAEPGFREIANSSTEHFRESADTSTNCPCCGRKPLKNKTCSVAGCEGKHVARGLCHRHYDMKRREDPEQVEKFREANRQFHARKRAKISASQQEVEYKVAEWLRQRKEVKP